MAWYDPNKTLTHNALFNIIIGARSCGKSYGLKKRAITNFKKNGQQFIYLRRNGTELDESKEGYFDDIIQDQVFPEDKIEYESDCYFLNGQLMGYAMALTLARHYKSSSFPLVGLIIFEEFIIEEDQYNRYLKNEVRTFLGFYMSIDRYRGVKVFFLGNNYKFYNPYITYWDIKKPFGSQIAKAKNGMILLEMLDDPELAAERKRTPFGQIIEGTEFADYAIDNKSAIETNTFIMKKTERSTYYFTFKYSNNYYGVWVDYSEGKFFVSENIDSFCKVVYSITLDDHSPNTMLLKSINRAILFKTFIENYKAGNVYFESIKVKNIASEVIRLCIN